MNDILYYNEQFQISKTFSDIYFHDLPNYVMFVDLYNEITKHSEVDITILFERLSS
jgi:hypothetical protein